MSATPDDIEAMQNDLREFNRRIQELKTQNVRLTLENRRMRAALEETAPAPMTARLDLVAIRARLASASRKTFPNMEAAKLEWGEFNRHAKADMRALLAEIDAQAARIAELEKEHRP